MKEKQKTREHLVIELAETNLIINKAKDSDERRRKEFAKAFNWYKKGRYDSESEPTIPSWEEIFVQVGKLLREKDSLDILKRFNELESHIDHFINNFSKPEVDKREGVNCEPTDRFNQR